LSAFTSQPGLTVLRRQHLVASELQASSLAQGSSQGKAWHHPPVLFALGSVSAVIESIFYAIKGLGSNNEMVTVAKNLAQEGSFANPFSILASGPTAHVAPLYPLFLASLLKITGGSPGFEWIADRVLICIHGLAAALLVSVSKIFYEKETPGVYGAMASILLPVFLLLAGWEAMASALGLMLFCICSHRAFRSNRCPAAKGAAIGLFSGLILLLNPACLAPMVLWMIFVWRQTRPLLSARHFVAGAALACAFTCIPWITRCYNQFGSLFPIRDNLGLELYAANNDCAEFSLARNIHNGCSKVTHPNGSLTEARLVQSMGELNYNRYRMRSAINWIRQHPGRFFALTTQRFLHFWYIEPDAEGERLPVYSIWLLSLLSIVGMGVMAVRRLPILWFVVSVFVVYPIPYYFVQSSARFLYPIFWLNLLCAGYCLDFVFRHFRQRRVTAAI
jgi:hypothetical protein